jgi:hypothetical protein
MGADFWNGMQNCRGQCLEHSALLRGWGDLLLGTFPSVCHKSPRSLWKCVSADRDLFLWCLQVHFDDFVHQLIDISDLIQNSREQSALQFQV